MREHIGVRHVRRKRKMVLGKRLLREHIGVRCMVWQEKTKAKTGHLEDRMLSDVGEEKTFDSWSKGRVTSGINVSPPKI